MEILGILLIIGVLTSISLIVWILILCCEKLFDSVNDFDSILSMDADIYDEFISRNDENQ
tara:strand:- start:1822 stop:2001 length:180 start_codon:yes stop_codon:yes gene_type:complete